MSENKDRINQPDYTGTASFYNGKKKFRIAVWSRKNRQRGEGLKTRYQNPGMTDC